MFKLHQPEDSWLICMLPTHLNSLKWMKLIAEALEFSTYGFALFQFGILIEEFVYLCLAAGIHYGGAMLWRKEECSDVDRNWR